MKIAYGNANFADIRKRGSFYVDKTPFLPMLESDELGAKNIIFMRPRRFGKSSLLSMMEHYYDIHLSYQYDELFQGLWIHEHPTPEKSKHMVLHLDFSQMSVGDGEQELKTGFYTVVKAAVRSLGARYKNRVADLGGLVDRLENIQDPANLMAELVGIMSAADAALYVMIDEYDTFAVALLAAEQKDVYSKVTDKLGFVRAFYRTLKAGTQTGAIARVFITGGTPILLDDLVTGFNVVTNISNNRDYNTLAGFTEADVVRAVDELLQGKPELLSIPEVGDRQQLLQTLEEFFDGYRFAQDAKERVFNSTMVLYFLRELGRRGSFPMDILDPNARTDYRKLHSLWAAAGPQAEERREAIEKVLETGEVWSELVDRFGVKTGSTTSQFVSLMYYTGMLTLTTDPPLGKLVRFQTPNRVIRELGYEHYMNLLEDIRGIHMTDEPVGSALGVMAQKGDIQPFLDVLRKRVLMAVSVKDVRKHDEKAMKMLLIGALVTSRIFYVLSEKEWAHGFNDLFMSPLSNVPQAKYAWMIELKYLTTKERKKVGKVVEEAETQLAQYLADPNLVPMLSKGLELKVGTMVFVGNKDVEWREMDTVGGQRPKPPS
jgi:hypothetical protein